MTDANTTVIPLLRDSLVAEHEKEKRGFLALLICAQREDIPVHILCGKTDLLRIIQSCSVSDKLQQYLNSGAMIRVDTCAGTELIRVEFLNSDLYDNYYDAGKELDRKQCSSLSSILSTSPLRIKAVRLAFARAVAWETNPDGSWLSEAQLRQRFRRGLHSNRCTCEQENSFAFHDNCSALPGDTICWRWCKCGVHPPRKQATRFQPASDAELQAREHTMDGGLLFSYCKRQREDPEDSDDEDSEMGGSDDDNSERGDSNDDEDSELEDSDEQE
jgi:hypothetical protein